MKTDEYMEYIIVENNSVKDRNLCVLRTALRTEAAESKGCLLEGIKGFNYPAINNTGVRHEPKRRLPVVPE